MSITPASMHQAWLKTSMGMNPQWWGCHFFGKKKHPPQLDVSGWFHGKNAWLRGCFFVGPLDPGKQWGSEPQSEILSRGVCVPLGAPAVVSLVIWLHPSLAGKVETLPLRENHGLESSFILGLLSGNQTWQWNIPHLKMICMKSNKKIGHFPLPSLIFRGESWLIYLPDFCVQPPTWSIRSSQWSARSMSPALAPQMMFLSANISWTSWNVSYNPLINHPQ